MRRYMQWFVGVAFCTLGLFALAAWGGEDGKKTCPHAAAAKGDDAKCPSQAQQAAGARGCKESDASKALADLPAYRDAQELISAWSEQRARLVAMTPEDRAARKERYERFEKTHPAAAHFRPTALYLAQATGLAEQLNAAAERLCAENCDKSACGTAAGGCGTAAGSCEQTKARRIALISTAHRLAATVASTIAAEGDTECDKAKTAAKADAPSGCCAAQATLASADKPGGCTKEHAAAGSGCDKAKATLTAGQTAGGCCKSKGQTASAEGCCKEKAGRRAAEGEDCSKACLKATTAKAESLTQQGKELLAAWEQTGAKLASMTADDRSAADRTLVEAQSSCPVGSLLPKTIATVQALLAEADRLDKPCSAGCAKGGKSATAAEDISRLRESSRNLVKVTLQVAERMSGAMSTTRTMAAAQ